MTRACLFVAALLVGASVVHGAVPSAIRPNVLLVCVDDLKPLLGCYGDKAVKSPNIDRLAARGLVFERAYCNQAVCAPSRNALLTGVRPSTMGIYDLGTNFRVAFSNAITLPQYFLQQGYRTEALGKIFHVGHGNHEDPASWSVPHVQQKSIAYVLPESRANQGLTREEALFENQDPKGLPRGVPYESADVPDHAYPDGKIAEEAGRRLRAAAKKPGEPFFLAIGFLKPHLPFCAPKKYWDLYNRASFAVPAQRTAPEGAPKYAPSNWGELRQYSDIPGSGPLTDEQARTMIHGYHAAVSYMDAQLGKVLDELDRVGLATNTIILLWGDHGWHLGDHGWWCKHDNYEQTARIPLIVAAPGVTTPGTRATALVEAVDIFPTLTELAGLPAPRVPQGIEGKSFAPILRDPSLSTKSYLYHAYPRGERIGRAVRTARYRLIEWKVPGRAAATADLELYDYEQDPLETRNLAIEQPDTAARLQAILAELPEAKPQITGVKRSTAKPTRDQTAPPAYKRPVMTWVPPYAVSPSKARLEQSFGGAGMKSALTHLGLQFWKPTMDGGLIRAGRADEVNDAVISDLRDWGRTNGVRVLLCVYNAVNGKWDWPLARAGFAENPDKFVEALMTEVERLQLDGVDVDLEGNGSFEADRKAFVTFVRTLSERCHAAGKHVTLDTFSYKWNAPNQTWWPDLLPHVDALTTMGYEEIGATALEWRGYEAQKLAAGEHALKLMIGLPSGRDAWRGNTVLEHLQWLKDDGHVGVSFWDAQVKGTAWQKPEVWEALGAIRGRPSL